MKRRRWVYVMRPNEYDVAGCPCGNVDPDWSEFAGHLWCQKCQKDFIPEHNGVFDGPIPINAAALMGLNFAQFNIKTGKVRDLNTRMKLTAERQKEGA